MAESFTMPMPGTIGGAKIFFKEEQMQNYTIKLTTEFIFEVTAENMDQACDTARHFFNTMKHSWGEHANNLTWIDSLIVKQSAEQEVSE